MFLLRDNLCEKFSDSRGFDYTIFQEKLFTIKVQVDTIDESFVFDTHLKTLEWCRKTIAEKNLFETIKINNIFASELFDKLELNFSNISDFETWQHEMQKPNILLDLIEELRTWVEKMPSGNADTKKAGDLLNIGNIGNIGKKIEEWFKQITDDFSTLTIITQGAEVDGKRPEIKTDIAITGDITSVTNLSNENLANYHERMLNLSVNLVKSYIQVVIQIVGILLPFAGLGETGKEALKAITEMVKAFSTKES